ncbi:Cd2+/Zn2+-exporting ATPase [Peptoniphilus olsenii]|uniref:Cd(2+)-exporting ATPase n=1 Tax=Peptoniphilus olsenii TaxID=411570 RepID=A0ABV2J9P5_9FIRM
MISYEFIMRNLGCANCAEKIRAKLDSMDNIEDVKFNINTQKLSLKSDIKDEERLMKIIQEVADSIEDGVKVEENYEFNDEEDDDKPSIIKFILVFCSLIFLHFLNLDDKVEFVIYILLFVVVGREVILSAVKGLKRKDFLDEEFLMTVASVAAIVAGEYAEAVAVMLFYSVGEYIQDKAVDNSRKSIKETLKLKPDFANVFRNEELIKIDPVDVNVGDKILIRPGEKVPLDGIITKGISDVDTSNISGEFAPVSLGLGDRIVAGYINLENSLEVKVEKEYREGTIAKIIDLVENASSNKAEIEKFITRFARVYTPIVLSLASILFVLLKFFVGYGFKESLYRSAIFLVISCPCALVLSVPLTMFAGIGSLSKKSIFVKGGNSVEALTDIDAIAFDKTGTITKGKLTVDDILELNANKEEILEIAAIGEKYSTHPIAKAILDKKDIKQNPENLKNISGKGLEFLHNRKKYFVGNSKIIDDNNIKRNLSIENPNKIEVFVADEEKLLGIIFLSDTIKEDAKESIDFFKKLNIKTYILSGDKDSIAKEIASQIGVDNARGSLLPEDKLNEINELMKDNKLAYVGDGTNDAPALASAYLGIGMSSGTDIAIESSDIILFNNDISSIVEAIKISKRVKNIAYQNIFIALFLKVVVLILGALGNVSMPLAVFADVGVALICILNSLRVFKSE